MKSKNIILILILYSMIEYNQKVKRMEDIPN